MNIEWFKFFLCQWNTMSMSSHFFTCRLPGRDDAEENGAEFGFSLRDHDWECLLLQQPSGQCIDGAHWAPTHAQLHPPTSLQGLVQSHHREGGLFQHRVVTLVPESVLRRWVVSPVSTEKVGCFTTDTAEKVGCFTKDITEKMGCFTTDTAQKVGCFTTDTTEKMGCFTIDTAEKVGCFTTGLLHLSQSQYWEVGCFITEKVGCFTTVTTKKVGCFTTTLLLLSQSQYWEGGLFHHRVVTFVQSQQWEGRLFHHREGGLFHHSHH